MKMRALAAGSALVLYVGLVPTFAFSQDRWADKEPLEQNTTGGALVFPTPAPTPAAKAPPAAKPAPRPSGKPFWLGIGVYYSIARQIRYSDATVSSVSTAYTFDVDNAFMLALEARWDFAERWGLQGGLWLESYRKIKGYQYKIVDATISDTFSSVESKIGFALAYLNMFYRLGRLYFPVGLNIGTVHIQNPPLLMKESKSVPGAQAGVGFQFTDRFAVEALYRVLGISSKQIADPTSGTVVEGKTGYMPAWLLGIKASF